MKKLILISALLFSFNGWTEEGQGLITLKTYKSCKALSFVNKALVFDLVIEESSERLIFIRLANSLAI